MALFQVVLLPVIFLVMEFGIPDRVQLLGGARWGMSPEEDQVFRDAYNRRRKLRLWIGLPISIAGGFVGASHLTDFAKLPILVAIFISYGAVLAWELVSARRALEAHRVRQKG